jgi:prevent-host-death family protein
MKGTTVSVAEGKKRFSRLIKDALEKKAEIIVTKRGKPVVVIAPYEEYLHSQRVEGFRKILEVREVFLKKGIKANEILRKSRRQLEKRP